MVLGLWGSHIAICSRSNDLFSLGVKCLRVFIRPFECHCIHVVDLVVILLSTLMLQAILGGSVQVPTLTGDVLLKVSLFSYVLNSAGTVVMVLLEWISILLGSPFLRHFVKF